jgi:ankyrin repeat protein
MNVLHTAAWEGDEPVIQRLVSEGFLIDEQDDRRYSPLMYAAEAGHTGAARLLLELGADPDVHADYDTHSTPLSLAAWRGHFSVVKLLIAHGARPEIHAGPWQARAECYARSAGHHHISEFLEHQCK